MIDLVSDVIDFARYSATLTALLADAEGISADYDPTNSKRPYVVVNQSGYTPEYEPLGKQCRVEKIIVQFIVFSDTRADNVALLDALEALFLPADLSSLGRPKVMDKICQIDVNKIDAWRGTLNLQYLVQQSQPPA